MQTATLRLACLLLTSLGLAAPMTALAQTSEWQQRIAPGTKAVPKATPPQAPAGAPAPKPKVKAETVEAGKAPTAPLVGPQKGTLPTLRPSLGPSTVPNESVHNKASTDPAYDAYDQGKYLTALELAEKAARNGEAQAFTLIGRIHAEGLAVPQNYATAAKAYAKGVELGDIEAAFSLGALYAQGQGVELNYDTAAKLFETAALKGHALANYNLAQLFLRGKGKTENPRRAHAHMLYAAERGVVAAQYDVATMLATGIGTEANAFEGAKWMAKAARAGHVEAEIEYAIILFKVDVDPNEPDPLAKRDAEAKQKAAHAEAVTLLKSAAEKGNAIGQNRLARCYANGLGVAKDLVEAAKWNLIARDGGIEDEGLDKMLAKLSRADKQKAEVAADAWRDRSQVQ
ncbi:MAG: tetratricopeptide repeat protein [Hyphomicrobiaceae bacterium]